MEKRCKLESLDAYVETMMKEWQVPGLAIAVVKDGDVIVSKGYGMRSVKDQQPVTEDTLFAIGSATKAFTAMSLGILVDEGKLNWDTPVRHYLPEFELYDRVATERMTPRDLLCHRSGLPRHDLMWYNSPFTREELFQRLRYLKPSKDFRTTWQYSNLMFMTAGYLAGRVAGTSWEQLVSERILQPLGMNTTNFSVEDSQQSSDYALPYTVKQDEIVEIPFRNISTVGPAGSINSSIRDMTAWLKLQLNQVLPNGNRLVSPNIIQEMHTPQMVMQQQSQYSELSHRSYGLGWFIESYRGYTVVHHGGNIDGFSALVTFMPRKNIGMVVLTNRNANPLPTIVSYYVYEKLLDLSQTDWHSRYQKLAEGNRQAAKAKKHKQAEERKDASPTHPLREYVGRYEHPGYGVAEVIMAENKLLLIYNGLRLPLDHLHYNVFQAEMKLFEMQLPVIFEMDKQGSIMYLKAALESLVDDIVFTKRPDKRLEEPGFLKKLAGDYYLEALDMTLRVALKGSSLALAMPGQPTRELVPYRDMVFGLKGLNGYSVEFELKDGQPVALQLVQPNGVFRAVRR